MSMNDIKLFAKNEKELETLIQFVGIYSPDKWMEFGIEKCDMLIMRSGKRQMTEEIEQPIINRSERSEEGKHSTWEFWKRTPSSKWGWKKKFKRVSQENEKTTWNPTI